MVKEIHVTKDGTPRKISFLDSKKLWYTKMPDGSKVYGTTREVLIEKLFKHYGLYVLDTSFNGIFNAALEEKANCDNNSSQTINKILYDYKRFISDDFSTKDIRSITKSDLKAYTQSMANRLHPKKKAFLAYKSILNLTFGYAIEQELISVNPATAINNRVYYKSCDMTKPKTEDKIFSADEIARIQKTVRTYMSYKRYNGYFINGYAILLSIETGMRVGEICSLKWSDISEKNIHIHSQQLSNTRPGKTLYYYADWTKDEKGYSHGGRYFPRTQQINAILDELQALQKHLGIQSEYVFCHEDGDWIKTDAYITCLRRLCQHLQLDVTNNHAFRMSLNSNVFIPLGVPVTDRAKLLGHSVETNLRHYSYARKDNADHICELLNSRSPLGHPSNVVV